MKVDNSQDLEDVLEVFGFEPSCFAAKDERQSSLLQEVYKKWEIRLDMEGDKTTGYVIINTCDDDDVYYCPSSHCSEGLANRDEVLTHPRKAIDAVEDFLGLTE